MASTSSDISVIVSYNGHPTTLSFDPSASLSDLHQSLYEHFGVPSSSQKLILKGKRIASDAPSTTLLSSLLPSNAKLLLVGAREADLEQHRVAEETRQKKLDAYAYHKVHGTKVRNTTVGTLDGADVYRFHEVRPFPETVPAFEKRKAMLERLVRDEAIREVMRKHRTELHPHINPDLLGLNKNKGQEICLRLLTDDLEGTRSYVEVRKVLIHELVHNEISPHDNSFNELNSLLTKEVVANETSRGLRVGQEELEPWSPSGDDIERTSHTLNEEESEPRRHVLRMGPEDVLDEQRERMRKAAEERQRREKDGGGSRGGGVGRI
ncbi:WLM domain containing protein [Pseudohyphozyma bogoriensis]|nr:WLM domain containing protein [Pseudohyphozyma bogoriensis]